MGDIGIKVTTAVKVPVKYLRARCGVRYWEDATVNGERDDDGSRIPCRKGTAADNDRLGGGDWCPLIELATGKILNWPEGTTADIHYKVCDDGDYELLDAEHNVVSAIEGYVPGIMSPGDSDGDSSYGDYVIMTIGPNGVIANWRVDLADFERKAKQ
jgi:hypothetical protein